MPPGLSAPGAAFGPTVVLAAKPPPKPPLPPQTMLRGMRGGRWSAEEEAYADKVFELFNAGSVPNCPEGTMFRSLLVGLLNCAPMRVSKKFFGVRAIGKQGYKRVVDDRQITMAENAIRPLEQAFHDVVGAGCLKMSLVQTSGLITPLVRRLPQGVPVHASVGYMPAAAEPARPPAPPKRKAVPRKRQTSKINRSLIGFEHDPRDVAFESLRFSDSLRSQYNNALRHFVGYVKERKMDPAEAVVFVSPDGVAKDDMLRDFARYLHDSDGVTDSVFRNCLKWMQKNLEAQMTALDLPPPKAYVSRLPGMRELNHLQRPKQMAQRAIADAKDAELIRKLNAKGRGVAPGP